MSIASCGSFVHHRDYNGKESELRLEVKQYISQSEYNQLLTAGLKTLRIFVPLAMQ